MSTKQTDKEQNKANVQKQFPAHYTFTPRKLSEATYDALEGRDLEAITWLIENHWGQPGQHSTPDRIPLDFIDHTAQTIVPVKQALDDGDVEFVQALIEKDYFDLGRGVKSWVKNAHEIGFQLAVSGREEILDWVADDARTTPHYEGALNSLLFYNLDALGSFLDRLDSIPPEPFQDKVADAKHNEDYKDLARTLVIGMKHVPNFLDLVGVDAEEARSIIDNHYEGEGDESLIALDQV